MTFPELPEQDIKRLGESLSRVNPIQGGMTLRETSDFLQQWLPKTGDLSISGTSTPPLELPYSLQGNTQNCIITLLSVLTSSEDPDYQFKLSHLRQILEGLAKLHPDREISAIQFILDVRTSMRKHAVNILIYKDPANNVVNINIIDSTSNPFELRDGVFHIAKFFGMIRGQPTIKDQLRSHLTTPGGKNLIRLLFGDVSRINDIETFQTGIQPSIGDKRCGVFALNCAYRLSELFTEERHDQHILVSYKADKSSIKPTAASAISTDEDDVDIVVGQSPIESTADSFEIIPRAIMPETIKSIALYAHSEVNNPLVNTLAADMQREVERGLHKYSASDMIEFSDDEDEKKSPRSPKKQ